MNTEHLQYLLTTAQYGSMNQAAEALHLQRAHLSRVISNLEQQLGITIFDRVPKGVVLTPEGEYAVKQISTSLEILNELQQHFTPQQEVCYPQYSDKLFFYYPASMRSRNKLTILLDHYQRLFPNVTLSLYDCSSTFTAETFSKKENQINLIAHSKSIAQLDFDLPEGFTFLPLIEVPVVALVSSKNPLADSYQTISLNTLCKQDLLLMQSSTAEYPLFYDLLIQNGKPNIKQISHNNPILFNQLLKTGRYFSIGIFSSNKEDDLRQIPLRENITVTFGLLFEPKVLDNFPAKMFIETIHTYSEE